MTPSLCVLAMLLTGSTITWAVILHSIHLRRPKE
jgi:hypothetical protein